MNRISDSTLKEADFLCDYIRSNFPKLNELQLQVILLNYDLSGQIETNFINIIKKYGFNSLPNFKDEEIILLVVDYLFTDINKRYTREYTQDMIDVLNMLIKIYAELENKEKWRSNGELQYKK